MNEDNSRRNYNGWTNYETWAVSRWLDNEEPSYCYWTEQARWWKGREDDRVRFADQLREEIHDGVPGDVPDLYADLLHAALSEVNWAKIAADYLDAVGDDEGTEDEDPAEAATGGAEAGADPAEAGAGDFPRPLKSPQPSRKIINKT